MLRLAERLTATTSSCSPPLRLRREPTGGEHNLWVRQVAEEFQRADASGTPEPVAFVTPQPSPVPEPVSTPTVPPAETDTFSLPAGDFWLSRAIDGATEAYKALGKPPRVTRLVQQGVEC